MEDNIEVNVIKLEDDLEYIIIDTIMNNENKYLIMMKEENEEEIFVRKILEIDNKEYLEKLDDEEEFDEVMQIYSEKYLEKKGENNEE